MVTLQKLPKYSGLCIRRKQTKELLATYFTVLQGLLEMAPMFMDTVQLCVGKKPHNVLKIQSLFFISLTNYGIRCCSSCLLLTALA